MTLSCFSTRGGIFRINLSGYQEYCRKIRYRLIPTFGEVVLRLPCRYCIFGQFNEDAQASGDAQTDEFNQSKASEHVQEDSLARRVQVSCRRLLRERGDSFLSVPGPRFGAAFGHELYRDARGQRLALHCPCRPLPDFLLPRLHSKVERPSNHN